MLHKFIDDNRDAIIGRCRAKVAARSVPRPTDNEIDHGVPMFLGQLVETLRLGTSGNSEIGKVAVEHGRDLLRQGFTVSQVVHDYGDVCQTITEMAMELEAPISAQEFRTLNACLDDAIAGAVTEYGRRQNQSMLDGETARGNERLGFLAHELRNLTNTAIVAFEVLKTGNVGVGGGTGAVLHRSLAGMRALVSRSFDEVRLMQEVRPRVPFLVAEFIEEVTPTASQEAHSMGITLDVLPVEQGVTIQADRDILSAALGNLLQNAFKFTRPQTTVTLRVIADRGHVLIEVQDECGGLPPGDADELFRSFEQRGVDRTGLGLGLAFCRWGIQANDGQVSARSLPGRGCVFTIDMPRVLAGAGAPV